ncbi:MAG: hypothetical protein D6686_05220 [Alphaproteobacteria bacterium]|nr:MAG: hypothetical protein D6686_05220 [Alphaproteobacteria bacterium]
MNDKPLARDVHRKAADDGSTPRGRLVLVALWTPFVIALAHVAAFGITPVQTLAVTLALGLLGEVSLFRAAEGKRAAAPARAATRPHHAKA